MTTSQRASGNGHKNASESASAWHAGSFLSWIQRVAGGLAFVRAVLRVSGGRDATAEDADDATEDTPSVELRPSALELVEPSRQWKLTVLTFAQIEGAERAFATALGRDGDAPWLREVAFVESHRDGRIAVRGRFGGHDLDITDLERARLSDARMLPELRANVAEGCSALVVLALRDHVDAVLAAFAGRASRTIRHQISASEESLASGQRPIRAGLPVPTGLPC